MPVGSVGARTSGGTISRKQLPDRVAITWLGVPEYQTTNQNSLQIELFFDGRVRITQRFGAVVFLDGDDLYYADHIAVCCSALADPGLDYVKTGMRMADPVHPDWKARIEARSPCSIHSCKVLRSPPLENTCGWVDCITTP